MRRDRFSNSEEAGLALGALSELSAKLSDSASRKKAISGISVTSFEQRLLLLLDLPGVLP